MKIGLLNIATNRYLEFIDGLYNSALEYFLAKEGHEVTFFLFTNLPDNVKREDTTVIYQEHYPWPGMTLRRYEIFCNNSDKLSSMDYLYYCDIDMLFEGYVGNEVLGDSVATLHPGYWNAPLHVLSYDRNPISKAYVPPLGGHRYYAGGFNGGTTNNFLKMSEAIYKNIEEDKNNGYVAVWHDESHLNRYFIDNPPSVVLDPSYCFPKDAVWAVNHPYRATKKLCALEKDHKVYQI
jgi:histo-blood group ABO system transferase